MEKIILCVLSLSISGALSGALILLVRPVTQRMFSKGWNYYIWLLVAVRLLVPVYLENSYSLTLSEYMGIKRQPQSFETAPKDDAQREDPGDGDSAMGEELGKEDTIQNADFGKKSGSLGAGLEKEDILQRTEQEETDKTRVSKMESVQPGKPQAAKRIGAVLGMVWILGAGISFYLKIKNYYCFSKYIKKIGK